MRRFLYTGGRVAVGQGYPRRSNLFEVLLLLFYWLKIVCARAGMPQDRLIRLGRTPPGKSIMSRFGFFLIALKPAVCHYFGIFFNGSILGVFLRIYGRWFFLFHLAASPGPDGRTFEQSWARLQIREVVPVRTCNLVQFTHVLRKTNSPTSCLSSLHLRSIVMRLALCLCIGEALLPRLSHDPNRDTYVSKIGALGRRTRQPPPCCSTPAGGYKSQAPDIRCSKVIFAQVVFGSPFIDPLL